MHHFVSCLALLLRVDAIQSKNASIGGYGLMHSKTKIDALLK